MFKRHHQLRTADSCTGHLLGGSPSWMKRATCSKSFSVNPREVSAGVPSRIPPGRRAEASPGQVFLLQVMRAKSNTCSAFAPSIPFGLRSTRHKWLSVPPGKHECVCQKVKHSVANRRDSPVASVYPKEMSFSLRAWALASTCFEYLTNSSLRHCFSATAIPESATLGLPFQLSCLHQPYKYSITSGLLNASD